MPRGESPLLPRALRRMVPFMMRLSALMSPPQANKITCALSDKSSWRFMQISSAICMCVKRAPHRTKPTRAAQAGKAHQKACKNCQRVVSDALTQPHLDPQKLDVVDDP